MLEPVHHHRIYFCDETTPATTTAAYSSLTDYGSRQFQLILCVSFLRQLIYCVAGTNSSNNSGSSSCWVEVMVLALVAVGVVVALGRSMIVVVRGGGGGVGGVE